MATFTVMYLNWCSSVRSK